MDITRIKKNIDLKEYTRNYYGIRVYSSGKASCPFHPPDTNPSLQFWVGNDGIHRFTDWHTKEKGTIIDFVMRMEGCSVHGAIQKIKKDLGMEQERFEKMFYVYFDLRGRPVYRKVRGQDRFGNKLFWFEHEEDGNWVKGKGEHELIPYNLPDSEKYKKAIICEGEKDVETIKNIVESQDLDFWVTSAPNGKASWPPSITKYFRHMKETIFLYDVGAEEDAKQHASTLKSTYPEMDIYIAKIPSDEEGTDITDFLKKEKENTNGSARVQTT